MPARNGRNHTAHVRTDRRYVDVRIAVFDVKAVFRGVLFQDFAAIGKELTFAICRSDVDAQIIHTAILLAKRARI